MIPFLLSFGTALCKTVSDITQKRATTSVPYDEIIILAQRVIEVLLALLVLGGLTLWFSYSLTLSNSFVEFLGIVLLGSVTSFAGFYCNVRALRLSDVSLVSPISQLTPALLLITAPLMLGESVSMGGAIGVLLVVLGAYLLGVRHGTTGLLAPLVHLTRDRGVRLALLGSVFYGVSSNFDKMGVLVSDPVTYIIASGTLTIVGILVYTYATAPSRFKTIPYSAEHGLYPGLSGGIGSLLQMTALAYWPVAYVISVKRLSTVFSVVAGYVFFKEEVTYMRLMGSIIMVLGTASILIFG